MIRLLQLIIFGHVHKWKVVKTEKYQDFGSRFGDQSDIVAQGTVYTRECEYCGELKVFKN